jgi:hypothetical protein
MDRPYFAFFRRRINTFAPVRPGSWLDPNDRITEANFGIYSGGLNWGKYRDNVTVNVGVPYTGGTSIANNN